MSYTRPAYNAADGSWVGSAAYTRPAYNAADGSWQSAVLTGRIAIPSPLGAPALLGVVGVIPEGLIAVPGPLGSPVLVGRSVVFALAACPSPLGVPAVVGTVVRYELRGEVRDQGVLVERRVRAYRRDTGGLVGEADTVVGHFVVHAGFAPREHYVIPVNLDVAATDFSPPCANRIMSALAVDGAA